MTRRQLIFTGIFILIVFLAFILRDVVEAMIIIPVAFLWWLLKLYYASLPQAIFWALLAAFAGYSAITTVIPAIRIHTKRKVEVRIAQGRIEILADWLKKSQRGGTYYKWLIANRLGKNAREILAQREGDLISKKFGALSGRGWNPPQKTDAYLNAGLNGSFTSIPPKKWSLIKKSPPPTPLDVDPQQVIDYLEDEMEM